MNKRCIVNVATGQLYTKLQSRLIKSLQPYSEEFDVLTWTDEYPPNSRTHAESLYGFKVHAIQAAIDKGYTQILWLDAACYAIASPKVFFDFIDKQGYYLLSDESNHGFRDAVSDCFLDLHDIKREDINCSLLSGSIYGFDIANPIGEKLFYGLYEAEACDLFMDCYIDDSARIDGNKHIVRPDNSINQQCDHVPSHRHDEAVLTYLAMKLNCKLDNLFSGYFQQDVILANKQVGL